MAKYKSRNFLQIDRSIFNIPKFTTLTTQSKWLYICLSELEHKFTLGKRSTEPFYSSDNSISLMSGIPLRSFKRCKKELLNAGFISITKKKTPSRAYITVYSISCKIHFENYDEYLKGDHWKKTAARKRKLAGYRCEECKKKVCLDVHHKHYRTLHNESMNDLSALCRECHQNKS